MFINQLFEGLKNSCKVCGQTPCNCTHISEEKVRLDPKCWKGKKIGNPKTKMKGGVRVNNCVPESVVEGDGNVGQQIKAVYQKIYNAGDDAVEFAYYDSPIFAQYWDEYEGDLDSIIAEVDPSELQVIYSELQSAAEDQGLTEGAEFGSIYAEQLAQQTFDIKPDLKDENEVLNLGYSIAVRELGPRARGFFRDEDFPSDFVSAYGWLQDQKQGVAEADQLPGTPVVSLKDLGDKDTKKDRYGRTVPKKLKKDDPRVKFHKDPKQGVTEMDKSQPSHGRDGRISHSTYGSRDKGGSQGQDRTARMTTADRMMRDAEKKFLKHMSNAEKVDKGYRNPNIDEQGVAEGYDGSEPLDLNSKPSVNDIFKRALYIHDYEGYGNNMDYSEDEAIDQYLERTYGPDMVEKLNRARQQSYFGRDDGRGSGHLRSSNLGSAGAKPGQFRTTKAGVMHKQDARLAKDKIKDRLGRHPAPALPENVNEVSDATLTSYLTKVDADSQKHEKDPSKRSPAKRNKSVQGFSRAFNKLDARKEKTDEAFQNDEANLMYRYDSASGRLKQRMVSNHDEQAALRSGCAWTQDEALKKAGILRSKFDSKKFVQKQGSKWVQVFPYGNKDVDESQYDRGDYYSARQGGEYGKGLTASNIGGGGNYIDKGAMDGQRGRPKKVSGFTDKLPADPFGRTTGAVPASAKPKKTLDPFRDVKEVSKGTLGNYLKRAHQDVVDRASSSSFASAQAGDQYNKADATAKDQKREQGMNRAVDRLTKENDDKEADYGKIYQDMVSRVGDKAKEQERKHGPVDMAKLAQKLQKLDKDQ